MSSAIVSDLDQTRLAKGIRAALGDVPREELRAAVESMKAVNLDECGQSLKTAAVELTKYLEARHRVRKAGWK